MEHHAPIIEETEKEVCFQVLALPINNIDVLIYQWTISDRHLLHSCTTIVTLFSFTLSFHGLQSSPPSFDTKVAFFKSHKSPGSSDILDAKKQQGQLLCDYCTSAKHHHCPHLQSLFVDLVNTISRDNVSIQSNPVEGRYDIFHFKDVDNEGVLQRYNSHIISRNGVYQINK